ncbi:MAG: hypothetical protein PHV68_03855 [Candidatus Gastranaerophilales bacterium]|nr:hypothetical protein [Candidatus Gastranaerophilales bacterium]
MKLGAINKFETKSTTRQRQDNTSFASMSLLANPALTTGLRFLDVEKMWGVGVIDTAATNVPRTVYDTKNRNIFAGVETCIREFSGLFVNCFSGGLMALGAAHLLKGTINKDYDINAEKIWANRDTVDTLTTAFKKKDGNLKGYLEEIIGNVRGAKNKISPEDAKDIVKTFKETIIVTDSPTISKESSSKLAAKIGTALAGDCEDLTLEVKHFDNGKEVVKKVSTSLDDFVRDTFSMAKVYTSKKVSVDNVDVVADKLKNLVTKKSALGLATVLIVATSIQGLNRKLTKKRAGKEGAPIHREFAQENFEYKMTDKEKSKLKIGKVFAVAGMTAIAAVSIGTKNLKNMKKLLEFKKPLPTLDQCRVIATATFASRMIAAEDKEELKETCVRDYGSFASLYFLGGPISTFFAKTFGKNDNLINPNNTLKTHNEVIYEEAKKAGVKVEEFITKKGKMQTKEVIEKLGDSAKDRLSKINGSHLTSMAWSMVALGLVLPPILDRMTKASDEKRKERLAMNSQENIVETSKTSMTGKTPAKDLFKEFNVK